MKIRSGKWQVVSGNWLGQGCRLTLCLTPAPRLSGERVGVRGFDPEMKSPSSPRPSPPFHGGKGESQNRVKLHPWAEMARSRAARHFSIVPRPSSLVNAFTLLELLLVIFIMGILAGLVVPALKNFGKSNTQASAARQLLDDVGRARQLAVSGHTTVYMVFVPAQFWLPPVSPISWTNGLTPAGLNAAANVLDKQYTGYNFLSLRSVGDQPGRSYPYYLSEWKSLPDGAFIAVRKFSGPAYNISDPSINGLYPITPFNTNSIFPFPTATNATGVSLPYIAFNYLGQLTVDGLNLATQDEYLPLAQGTVGYAADPTTKALQFVNCVAAENPPGNSTNSMFTLIHIDRLTGRADQKYQQVQ